MARRNASPIGRLALIDAQPTRRQALAAALTCTGAAGAWTLSPAAAEGASAEPDARPTRFRYCLNTGSIRGQAVPLPETLELAAQAGYDAVEPWIDEIVKYRDAGGSLPELDARRRDLGLEIPTAIGFAAWIADDPQQRAAGLEQARRDMDLLRQIGGTRIAAPPAGVPREAAPIALPVIAERYAQLLDVGASIGVAPQVEVWGFAQNLSRLAEAVYVAVASGRPNACVLADAYHLYKGGSDFAGLGLLSPAAMPCFHINDYPADPPRAQINDEHRVFPGDGIAPLDDIVRHLASRGASECVLSLELFNRTYWQREPQWVVETGLAKMRAAVERAMAAAA
jgi:sugar phosphate isomerase/epimerase